MLEKIRNKLFDIQIKLSDDSLNFIREVDTEEKNFLPAQLRGSKPSNSNMYYIQQAAGEARETSDLMNDFSKVEAMFYNTRESQLQSYIDRLEVLRIRQKVLKGFTFGVQEGLILMNDKKILAPGNNYRIDESGVWFPNTNNRRVTSYGLTLLADSNVLLGTRANAIVNSQVDAIRSTDQNDLLSVHRKDNKDLNLHMRFDLSSSLILNELEFEYIKKDGQHVSALVKDVDTQEVLYDDKVTDFWLNLTKPISTRSLLVVVTATGIDDNQLDIKRINLYQRKYTSQLEVSTISLPSFGEKYLTYEGVELADPAQADFLDIKVKANSEELFSFASDKGFKGPFKDPTFTLEVKIKDRNKAISYLTNAKYILGKNLPPRNTEYKVIQNILTENSFNIVNVAEGVNDVFIPLSIPGMEDFFYITVNGRKYERVLSTEPYTGTSYKISYTGDGYNLVFAALPLNSTVTCYVKTLPNVISRSYLYIPNNGLARDVGFKYAKELKVTRISCLPDDNGLIISGVSDIQRIMFKTEDGNDLVLNRKPLGTGLGLLDYSVNQETGAIFVNKNNESIAYAVIFYFEVGLASGKTNTIEKRVILPEQVETFVYEGKLKELIEDSADLYSLSYNSKEISKISHDKRSIQLPRGITLHKNSITIDSKKEVPFVDGYQEIHSSVISYEYFDFLETQGSVSKFVSRDRLLDVEKFMSSMLNIEDINFKVKKNSRELIVNTGDYCFEDNFLYIKTNQTLLSYVTVQVQQTPVLDIFSVDYSMNKIYLNNFSLDVGLEYSFAFAYSAIKIIDFAIDKEIEPKDSLRENEHYLYLDTDTSGENLLEYFTPVIESLKIGIVA